MLYWGNCHQKPLCFQHMIILNSKGVYAYHKTTGLEFNLTVRSNDGTGSGYAIKDFNDVKKFRPKEDSEIANTIMNVYYIG